MNAFILNRIASSTIPFCSPQEIRRHTTRPMLSELSGFCLRTIHCTAKACHLQLIQSKASLLTPYLVEGLMYVLERPLFSWSFEFSCFGCLDNTILKSGTTVKCFFL
mmetsp:Transcript_17699/g.50949  ORF Transcript_17699/g.50949 Transcript_17699/m.50949 type:complete len:107 (+) Transcript_17699:153-473(+)